MTDLNPARSVEILRLTTTSPVKLKLEQVVLIYSSPHSQSAILPTLPTLTISALKFEN